MVLVYDQALVRQMLCIMALIRGTQLEMATTGIGRQNVGVGVWRVYSTRLYTLFWGAGYKYLSRFKANPTQPYLTHPGLC